MLKTTVIIPNLNGKKYLNDCLSSLYACEEDTFPVIIVDNGSTDGSVDFIKTHFPQAELICFSENKGFCGAVNAGILAAKTPYVLLLNNDTTVETHFVSYLTRALLENEGYFSCAAKMVSKQNPELMDDAGDYYCVLGWAYARGKGKPAAHYMRARNIFAGCGGAVIYQREALIRLGLFDEAHFAYLEDIDVGYRARLLGYKNRFVPEAVVHHAGSASSGSRYNAFKVSLASRNSVYLVFKNMPPLQILINLPPLLAGFLIKALFFAKKGFGGLYLQGLKKGLALSFSKEGRARRVPFQIKRFWIYVQIEGELLYNLIVPRLLR